MRRLLLCTDLDRTLIPNGSQPESAGARQLFSRLVQLEGVELAYVSGRHRALIEEAIEAYGLPLPDFAMADVGTTIYRIEDGSWQQWQAWDDEIARDWRGMTAAALQALLSDIPALRLQEAEKQNVHKLSYYLPLQQDHTAVIETIDKRLKGEGVDANLIYSVDEARQSALLDILPAAANKLHAIKFLMQQEGYDPAHTLFAGDSGNDLDVLLSSLPSVLVANADREVRAAVGDAAQETLYLAKGGFMAMNGNYGAGILEGVAHFHPELIEQMREPG